MFKMLTRRALLVGAQLLFLVVAAPAQAQVDPSILSGLNYDQLQWSVDTVNPGSWYTVLSGNPSTPGRFVILNKVLKGNFTRPHLHPYARQIYVVSGTWWVGTGPTRIPANSVPKSEGTYVDHPANLVHWDGTKDEDVLLLIAGDGPAIDHFAY